MQNPVYNQPQTTVVEPTIVAPVINEPIEPLVNTQPVQNNNCSRCGAPTNPGDRFCMSCGNQL